MSDPDMSTGPGARVGVSSAVHWVLATEHGKRCCAAIVTGVADPTDAYRDHTYVGLRIWTDLDELRRPLLLGGSRHDPGTPDPDAVWACDGADHEGGTWHQPGEPLIRGTP